MVNKARTRVLSTAGKNVISTKKSRKARVVQTVVRKKDGIASGGSSKVPSTASAAAAFLAKSGNGYIVPTASQKKNVLVALAKKGKVVYGRAYDIVKITGSGPTVNLSDAADVEKNLDRIMIYEIKSTKRTIDPTFAGYFFALTTAELLVAQSLKEQFKFVFVNVSTKTILELTLNEIFTRAKGIYPTWSISF